MLGLPGQVVPQPRGLVVGIAVLAISHIGPLQVCHEGPALQQPGLRILNAPKARTQVPDQLQSSDGSAIALLEPAGPARQCAAVPSAGRRGPDHLKVAGREHGHRLPAAHVGAEGGFRAGVKIQAYHLPAQLPEGPAQRTVPAIVASSFSKSGWKKASQITAANKAQQQASLRLHRAHSQKPQTLLVIPSKNRAWLRLSCRAAPHLGRTSLWKAPRKAQVRPSNGAHPGQSADQLPRGKFHLRATLCGAPPSPAAVMWSFQPTRAKMAAKQAPAMFGKPRQLQKRFQSCLKTSPRASSS